MDTSQNKNESLESDVNRPVLTLGIVSQLSGIPTHSIRQYIEKGLLIPFKLDNNRQHFCMNDVSRLQHIHQLIQEKGLNFAGIKALLSMVPCWEIHKCSDEDRQNCDAYEADSAPCWEAAHKGRLCKNEECRECEVYTCLSHTTNLKSVMKSTLK